MTHNKRRGSDAERRVAKVVKGKRNPHTGFPCADVENEWATFEIKSRLGLPKWMIDAMRQVRENAARSPEKTAVLVFEHRARGQTERLYCVDEKTWIELHG